MRVSQSSTDSRKLATIVAIAIISAKLATMPAMPIAAKLGACAIRVTASSNVGDACESCPNGTREGDEECDDGNTVNGDGCTADCRVAAGPYRLYRARHTPGATPEEGNAS